MDIRNVTFPGLGIDLNIDAVAFQIGSFQIRWYALILSLIHI